MPIRTVLFEDHEVSRIALRLTLQERGDFDFVGEADDGFSAINVFEATKPDLVITELWLPHVDGLDVIRQLSDLHARARILVMSSYQSDENVMQSFLAGASGFCTKEVPKEDLLKAVDDVLCGELSFDRSCFKRMLEGAGVDVSNNHLSEISRLFLSGELCSRISAETDMDLTELASALRCDFKELMEKT